MFADKSALEEQQPAFIGMYDGKLMDESVREFVESCDLVLTIGTSMTDFNSGAFTAHLDPAKTVDIRHHRTQVGSTVYPDVEMRDILAELTRRVPKRNLKAPVPPSSLGPVVGSGGDAITADALYPRWANFIKPDDIVIAETGTSSMGLAFALMPKGATFHNQTLWGRDWMGNTSAVRRSASSSGSSCGVGDRRGIAPAHGAGNQPVRAPRSETDRIRTQQLRLSDRAPSL